MRQIIKCAQCHREFPSDNPRQELYCSQKCKTKAKVERIKAKYLRRSLITEEEIEVIQNISSGTRVELRIDPKFTELSENLKRNTSTELTGADVVSKAKCNTNTIAKVVEKNSTRPQDTSDSAIHSADIDSTTKSADAPAAPFPTLHQN